MVLGRPTSSSLTPVSPSLPFPSHEKRLQLSDWILFLPELLCDSVRAPSISGLTPRLFIRERIAALLPASLITRKWKTDYKAQYGWKHSNIIFLLFGSVYSGLICAHGLSLKVQTVCVLGSKITFSAGTYYQPHCFCWKEREKKISTNLQKPQELNHWARFKIMSKGVYYKLWFFFYFIRLIVCLLNRIYYDIM